MGAAGLHVTVEGNTDADTVEDLKNRLTGASGLGVDDLIL